MIDMTTSIHNIY